MKIKDTITLFEKLKNSTDKKSELKFYTNFILLLVDLEQKELTDYQFGLVEEELEPFNPDNKIKYFKNQFDSFQKFLKAEFSLVTKGYYTSIGMVLGMCFGVAFGTSIFSAGSTGTGLAVGIAIGLAIGSQLDSKAKKEGRVLNVNLNTF